MLRNQFFLLTILFLANRLGAMGSGDSAPPQWHADNSGPPGVRIVFPERLVLATALVPDKDHPFIPPGPRDMRGPCPGLNTLANHGYLPRNGIASVEQIINAAQTGFNVGYEFAKASASFAVLARGNPLINKVSLGGASPLVPPLPGKIDGIPGGLTKHGRFEGDVSMTRQDAAFGDPASFQPKMFQNMLTYVKKFGQDEGNIVTPDVFIHYRLDQFLFSISKNPKLLFHHGRRAFAYGESAFVLNMFADGLTKNLTTPVMSTFFQNETFPANWHRRNTPFTIDEIFAGSKALLNPRPVPKGAKNRDGVFIADEDPFEGGLCDIYLDLVGGNLPAVFMNTTGLLRENIETLLEGAHGLVRSYCPDPVFPAGEAGV